MWHESEINYILDFLHWWQGEYWQCMDDVPILKEKFDDRVPTFFGGVLHTYFAGDIYVLVVLLLNDCHHQANVILRRMVKYTLYSIWLDLISKFGFIEIFEDIYWDTTQWKPLIRGQRIKDQELKKKLKKIYDRIGKDGEELKDFRKRFFREGNEMDFFLLFSKIACEKCAMKKELKWDVLETNDEDLPGPEFVKPSFSYDQTQTPLCEYCGNKSVSYIAFCVPEIGTVFEILKKYFTDDTLNDLNDIQKIYGILSNHFVHLSFYVIPSQDDKAIFEINNKKVNLFGFEGTKYVLEKLSFILCNYFMILKNEFKYYEFPGKCKPRKRKFKSFF